MLAHIASVNIIKFSQAAISEIRFTSVIFAVKANSIPNAEQAIAPFTLPFEIAHFTSNCAACTINGRARVKG